MVDRSGHEETLAEREARLRALFAAIDEGYCLCEIVLDEAGEPADYRFLEINGRARAGQRCWCSARTGSSSGLERLRRAAADARDAPLPEICDRIVAELGVATKRDDDVVLLCARLVPATL
jgi:hypothetical protein